MNEHRSAVTLNENNEAYSPGYGSELVEHFQTRSVSKEAAFFAEYLKPGMTLLDCGCGPGTITVGLAKLVNPGSVIGIDLEATQIEASQVYAIKQNVENVHFEMGNIYAIPFPDATFDAVFAHAVLQHVKDPIKALKEVYRVLKPGGIAGLRDDDLSGLILAPEVPFVGELMKLLERVMVHKGGNHRVGKHHRELLRKAGFNRTKASASCECDGTLEATEKRGNLAAIFAETFIAEVAIPMGWSTAEELKEMAAAVRAWGKHPDAIDIAVWCEGIGWKD